MFPLIKKIHAFSIVSRRGLTLTELLVASILIGIVMASVASFTVAIKQIQETSNKTSLLTMQTTAAMNSISRTASLAIGFKDDMGIYTAVCAGGKYISFRLDGGTPSSPDVYTDDIWYIYSWGCQNPTAFDLLYCAQTVAQGGKVPNFGAGPCATAYSLTNKIASADFTINSSEFYVDLTLEARDNPAAPSDPLHNPLYTLETKVSPSAHSW